MKQGEKKIYILVVDDDKNLNHTVCTYLNDCGFEAKGVLSANEAYNEMYNNLYDLMLNAAVRNILIQILVPVAYWSVVAAGLTIFTRKQIRVNYEKRMHDLADAIRKVSGGDFSVYVPTIHTSEHLDYLDIMIIDFNKMVEELGSIETLKTDFFQCLP